MIKKMHIIKNTYDKKMDMASIQKITKFVKQKKNMIFMRICIN